MKITAKDVKEITYMLLVTFFSVLEQPGENHKGVATTPSLVRRGLKPISRSSQVYFCFYKQNIVFQANVMFDGQKWEFVSIKKCNISKTASLISWKQFTVVDG